MKQFARRLIATTAVAALGLVGIGSSVGSAKPTDPVASTSCTNVYISGRGSRCIAAGQFCSHKTSHEQAYKKAGYKCRRNGHLGYR